MLFSVGDFKQIFKQKKNRFDNIKRYYLCLLVYVKLKNKTIYIIKKVIRVEK